MIMLLQFLKDVLLIPVTLLPILNPLGVAPIFVSLLGTVSPDMEKRMARQVAINGMCMIVGAILTGSYVLHFFGISLPVVRVAGGMLVVAAGWKLLNDQGQEESIQTQVVKSYDEDMSDEELRMRVFFPITFPLTIGPGALAASLTLGANQPTGLADWAFSLGAMLTGSFLTVLAVYLCYRYAKRILSMLGHLGTMVVLRLSAFILVCIGLQILWSGIAGLLLDVNLGKP